MIVEPPVFQPEAVRPLMAGSNLIVEAPPRPWSGDDVVGLLIWQPVTAADIGRLPGLRVIVTGSIGVDHIDLEAAKRRGIWVCNVPDYCIDEVADTTIGLVLALVRGLVVLDRSVRDGQWNDHEAGPLLRGSDIRLGVVGFGRIGRAVAVRAQGLGMEVWAADPVVPAAGILAAGVRPASQDDLLRIVNAVTLHAPLGEHTRQLIGSRELALMAHGSYLVNTARGELVDIPALMAALDSGQLAGAALDVLPIEPPEADRIPRHPRLIVTPHAAWYSPTSEQEVVKKAVRSLHEALAGGQPEGAVVSGKLTID